MSEISARVENLLIRPGQAAALLGVARKTILEMARDGRLPYSHCTDGGHYRFRLADVVEYLEAHSEPGPAGQERQEQEGE